MNQGRANKKIQEALNILIALGLPKAQHNERSAVCLLALLNLTPDKKWGQSENPLMGITPIMEWARKYYQKDYAPNTRETVRRQTMHQFLGAGIALYNPDKTDRAVNCRSVREVFGTPGLYNPDKTDRAVNSPKTVYKIEKNVLDLLRSYGSREWLDKLRVYSAQRESLSARYAMDRKQNLVPIKIAKGKKISLSPGQHSQLIRDVIEEFAPRFVSGGVLVYVGDTGDKWGYFDKALLSDLGVQIDVHGKMPDVILFCPRRNWLLLVECFTSHGPMDGKRHWELSEIFSRSKAGLVFVTAFPNRVLLGRYVTEIAWETEVWVAKDPSHLIHFNGCRFLGPYLD